MNDILTRILFIVGIIAGIVVSGFIIDKIMSKNAKKKYRHEFSLMCYAVANEISSRTGCDLNGLRSQVDIYVTHCAEFPDAPCDPGVLEYYKIKDYRHFTYLSALKYESQFIYDDEHKKVADYCTFKMQEFYDYQLEPSYKARDDLNLAPKNNGYVVAIFVWVLGVPCLRLIYSIVQLAITIIERLFH